MKALLYLKKRTLVNAIKQGLKSPKFYLFSLFVLGYTAWIVTFLVGAVRDSGLSNPNSFVGVITIFAFFTMPTTILTYIKRKGIVFKKADVHFAFPSPISPKMNLIFAKITNYTMGILMGVIVIFVGLMGFHTKVLPTILFAMFLVLLQPILESAIIIILYGNENIGERMYMGIRILMYTIIAFFVGGVLLKLYFAGFSLDALVDLLVSPWILGVPIIGWLIAVARVLFLQPTVFSVIFSLCYLVAFLVTVFAAKRMRCEGGFYEDAMKFADDYEEAREKGKKGEVVFIGKKRKYISANVKYKGNYAKAIFYRQYLEYKKNRFFVFGPRTILLLILGIGLSVLMIKTDMAESVGSYAIFVLPALMMYIDFIFSQYISKWGKEMTYATLYLIPDTPFRKMWYATLMEHVRALADSLVLTLPAAIVLKFNIVEIVLTIFACMLIQANKLYLRVFVHGIFGNSVGNLGKQLIHLFFYGIILAIIVIPTVFLTMALGAFVGFILFNLILFALTFVCMLTASEVFKNIESVG